MPVEQPMRPFDSGTFFKEKISGRKIATLSPSNTARGFTAFRYLDARGVQASLPDDEFDATFVYDPAERILPRALRSEPDSLPGSLENPHVGPEPVVHTKPSPAQRIMAGLEDVAEIAKHGANCPAGEVAAYTVGESATNMMQMLTGLQSSLERMNDMTQQAIDPEQIKLLTPSGGELLWILRREADGQLTLRFREIIPIGGL